MFEELNHEGDDERCAIGVKDGVIDLFFGGRVR